MTDKLHQRAQRLIDSHAQMVEETKQWLDKPDGDVDRTAREIIVRERKLAYIVNHLQEQDNCTDDLQDGLAQVQEQNERLQNKYSGNYDKLLLKELEELVDRYPTIACYLFELDPVNVEVDHDFAIRDNIEMLMLILPNEKISIQTEVTVEAVDEVLHCRCRMYQDTYEEIEDFVSRPHYPTHFWWRHPEQIFSEN